MDRPTVEEILADGTPQYDDDGKLIEEWMTCGHCGRTWNDAVITSITPVPSGRCPFESEHEYDDE